MDLMLEVKDGFLYGTLTGHADIQLAVREFTRLCRHAAASGVEKALIDCRSVEGSLSTVERFELGEAVAHAFRGIGCPLRVAIVGFPPSINGFGALVASNRGVRAEVFNELDKAFAWLNS